MLKPNRKTNWKVEQLHEEKNPRTSTRELFKMSKVVEVLDDGCQPQGTKN